MNKFGEFNEREKEELEKVDVTSEEFKQQAINNLMMMNEHLDNVHKLTALMQAVPSVDQLTPDGWRIMVDYLPSLILMQQFLRDTLMASAKFVDDNESMQMIKGKALQHGHDQEG